MNYLHGRRKKNKLRASRIKSLFGELLLYPMCLIGTGIGSR